MRYCVAGPHSSKRKSNPDSSIGKKFQQQHENSVKKQCIGNPPVDRDSFKRKSVDVSTAGTVVEKFTVNGLNHHNKGRRVATPSDVLLLETDGHSMVAVYQFGPKGNDEKKTNTLIGYVSISDKLKVLYRHTQQGKIRFAYFPKPADKPYHRFRRTIFVHTEA